MKNKGKKLSGALAIGILYSSVFLLPYIKYVFYDAIIEGTGLNNTQIGFALSVYIAVCMVTTLISGYLADKFPIKKQLIITGIAHAALTCVYPFVMQSYAATLVIWGGMGITSMMFFWSQAFKGISMLGPKEEQGKLYGFFEASNGLGSLIVTFGALAVFSRFANTVSALKGVIFFYGIITLIATILIVILYKPQLEELEETKESVRKPSFKEILAVLKKPQIWIFSFVVFGMYAFYSGSSYLTPYFSTVLGVSVVFSGALASLKNYGTRLIGAPIAGIISDKISTTKFILISYSILLVTMIIFMLLPASPSVLVPITILMFILAFIVMGIKGVSMSMLDEINVAPEVVGSAVAVATMIGYNLPDLLLHPIFGKLLDTYEPVIAYKYIFFSMAAFILIGLISTIILSVKSKKEKANINQNNAA